MKGQYLHTFRREPDQEYTEKLYHQLERLPPAAAVPPQPRSAPSRKRRPAWAFAILIGAFFLTALVPGVRARFEDVLKQVGGLTIFMTEDYPGTDDPIIVPDEIMTLDEARSQVDFEFGLPAWVPDGLTLQADNVLINDLIDGLRVQWLDENGRGRALNLTISKVMPDVRFIVGPDSVTELTINGIPATLIRGGWYGDERKWKDDGSRSLRWQVDGVEYYLSTGNEEWGGLSDEELIKIAESISPAEAGEENSVRPEG